MMNVFTATELDMTTTIVSIYYDVNSSAFEIIDLNMYDVRQSYAV